MDNKTMIEKATMTLSDLASGGLMNPQQFNKFYRKIIDQPTIVNEARTVPMNSDQMKIEKIGFGQRILRVGQEAKALTDDQRSKPTTGKVELNAKEVIAEVNISYDTLENNIEKDSLQNTIVDMLAERSALDIEELVVNGDTALVGSDPYLGLFDGLRKQAQTHVVDNAGGAFARSVLKNLYGAVPAKYLRDATAFRYYMSNLNELNWRDEIASRQTNLGDTTLTGTNRPNAYGIPVEGIAMLQPYDYSKTSVKATDILLTHPQNIILGVSRNVRLEFDKDIRSRSFIIVLTMKLDAKFEEEDAVAKAINVKHEIK